MSIIYVNELAIRLPSDVRNIFNPLCAFGGSSSSNRSPAPVMGLREVQTGHVLLPIDAEGSVVVTPGQRYCVVLVRETRGGSAASAAASPTGTESSSVVSNAHQISADDNANRKNYRSASMTLQQQQLVEQPSSSREVPAAAAEAERAMPFSQKGMSKKERKGTRDLVIAKQFHGREPSSVPSVAAPEHPRKRQKRQDDDAAQASLQQQLLGQKSSPNANARIEAAYTDDAPLMEAYKSSQLHTSSRISPVMEPLKSGESSRHSSKRGSPRSKAETVVVPPPPIRHSLSSSNGYDDEEGAPSLAQLYSVQSAAAQHSAAELQHAGEGETCPTVTAKKRRSPSEKKTKSASADAAARVTALKAPSPLQPATSAAVAPAAQAQHQKSATPDRVPVTLPSSSRASTVRRVPLDTTSDSD